ncbi:MAG: hypothetical protein H6584_06905 [Flavobacteriales bacterium]|nr:hypothetical protein [Flavobacteriales bacterium]
MFEPKITLDDILTTRYHKDEMVAYLKNNSNEYLNAIELITSDAHPQAWRCAWLVGHCMKKNDPLIQSKIESIIDAILYKKEGHQRELLKILYKMQLTDEQEGKLFNLCMTIWETIGKTASVRITAFKFLITTLKKYPELKNEIDFLTQEQYTESLSSGLKHSFNKMVSSV